MAYAFGIESGRDIRETMGVQSPHLTPRQLEVLALLCEGLPNKLIGRRLNISSATVKIHVASILHALNVSSRLQAVVAAHGLAFEQRFGTMEATCQEPAAVSRPAVMLMAREGEPSHGPAAVADWPAEAAAD